MAFTWTRAGRCRTWTISTSSVHMPQGRRTGEARGIALLAHVVETTPFDSGHGKITLFLLLQTRPWGREYPAQPWSIIRQRVQRIELLPNQESSFQIGKASGFVPIPSRVPELEATPLGPRPNRPEPRSNPAAMEHNPAESAEDITRHSLTRQITAPARPASPDFATPSLH